MRYAIIQTGGKQYKAVEGETIEVDRLETEVGKKVDLKEVLLVSDDGNVMVGAPTVADAKVAATVVGQEKGEKITVFKYKPKIRYRVKTGHRQQFTRLMIDSIEAKGLAKSAPKAEAKAEAPAKAPAAKVKAPAAKAKRPAARKVAAKKPAVKKKTKK
ncbi:MAG: 50S ribosomal protein L21 [Anaerolineales bacterium]